MKRPQLSVLGLMGVIVGVALALAALATPTILRASLTFTATVAFLATAIVAAFARRGRARATWAGVAAFGWAYLRDSSLITTSVRVDQKRRSSEKSRPG